MKAPRIPSFLTSAPFLTAIRVLVGGLFVYAGLAKLMDPHAFLKAIDSFRILPTALISPLAIMLPPLEVVAGIAWIMNRCSKAAATIILGLCVVFLAPLDWPCCAGCPRIADVSSGWVPVRPAWGWHRFVMSSWWQRRAGG